MILPTTKLENPMLAVDPTAQYTFADSAPFLSIIDESDAVVNVVVV